MINRDLVVLVVGDTVGIEDAAEFLREAGFQSVYTASDNTSAWEQLEGNAVELVFSELRTPTLDGLGLLRSIRANQEYTHIPVVLLAVTMTPSEERVLQQARANSLIVGGFGQRDVLNVINQIFPEFR